MVREPGCEVMFDDAWPVARHSVAVRTDVGATGRSTASETASAPTGIVIEGWPAKVTVRVVSGLIALTPALPSTDRVTETAVTGRSVPPNALDSWSLSCRPPVDTCTVSRTVLLASTRFGWVNGAGGMVAGLVSCGIAVHVSTQRDAAVAARADDPDGKANIAAARPSTAAATSGTGHHSGFLMGCLAASTAHGKAFTASNPV